MAGRQRSRLAARPQRAGLAPGLPALYRQDRAAGRAADLRPPHDHHARRREGWDNEYPRDTWQLRRLGIDSQAVVTLQFTAISQPWLKDLAKRWTRWRLSCGLSPVACHRGVRAVTRFAAFLAATGITGAGQISRDVLERYLADLSGDPAGKRDHVGQVSLFLRDIRRHQWDACLPAAAMFFPEDFPRRGELLPRALAEHVMSQVEDPASLGRWTTRPTS